MLQQREILLQRDRVVNIRRKRVKRIRVEKRLKKREVMDRKWFKEENNALVRKRSCKRNRRKKK